jgi:autoinducer 2-degrading protein
LSKIALIVEYRVKPGRCDAFLGVIRAHAAGTLADEDGCMQFDVLVPREGADRVLLYEVYRDAAAYAVHGRSARLVNTRAAYAEMIDSRTITVCSVG